MANKHKVQLSRQKQVLKTELFEGTLKYTYKKSNLDFSKTLLCTNL